MSGTENTTATMDRLFTYGEQLAERLGELGQQYGPQVVDLTMNVYRIQAAQALAVGVICLLLCLCFTMWCVFCARRSRNFGWEGDGWAALCFFTGGPPAAVFFLVAIINLGNVWNWIGLWHPEILIAKHVLGL